jgi:ribosomal protein S27E
VHNKQCKSLTERTKDGCKRSRHSIATVFVMKRWFQCNQCKQRTSALSSLQPSVRCSNCNSDLWTRCGQARAGHTIDNEHNKVVAALSEWTDSNDASTALG